MTCGYVGTLEGCAGRGRQGCSGKRTYPGSVTERVIDWSRW